MADRDTKKQYAYLDQLSTEELQELLRADIDSPVSNNDEAIFYILEVIERRGCADPSVSFPDLGKSWKEFNELYNTAEATGASLYPADLENIQTIIYQKKYQEILIKQIDAALKNLTDHTYENIQEYLQTCYQITVATGRKV